MKLWISDNIDITKTPVFFLLIVVFWGVTSQNGFASVYGLVKDGNRYFQQRKYSKAEQKYKEALKYSPESDIINFDLGTDLYKQGDYKQSIHYLQSALLGDNVKLKQKALYNLGNAFYKLGIAQQNRNIDSAIKKLKKSLSYYKHALKINEKDKDAQYNYKFVEKELRRLQKKKKEQEKQQKNRHKKNKQCPLKRKQKNGNRGSKKGTKQKQSQNNTKGQRTKGQRGEKTKQRRTENNKSALKNKGQKGGSGKKQNKNKKNNGEGHQASIQQRQFGKKNNVSGKTGNGGVNKRYNQLNTSNSAYGDIQDINKTKAEMLLKKYQQTEAPKGLLNFYKGRRNFTPVLKDW